MLEDIEVVLMFPLKSPEVTEDNPVIIPSPTSIVSSNMILCPFNGLILIFDPNDTEDIVSPYNLNTPAPPSDLEPASIFKNSIVVGFSGNVTFRTFPSFVIPFPGSICPAPENCENIISDVPNVILALLIKTKPLLPLVVPSSINVNAPGPTSVFSLKSDARVKTHFVFESPRVVTV